MYWNPPFWDLCLSWRSLCYKSHRLFPGDICEHDSVLTQESTASGGRGGWTILPSCSASTTPDKISQELLGDTPGDGSCRLELDNTFLSARLITWPQRTNSAPPSMPPAALSPPTSSSESQSMWHIYATSVLSNNSLFFFCHWILSSCPGSSHVLMTAPLL